MQNTNFREQFTNVADACALAQSIVDTVREPVIVLDKALRVIAASRSFYTAFEVSPEETQGKLLYALGDGQWDIPRLRLLLEKIIPAHGVMEDYEVEHAFPHLGTRIMRLNASQVFYKEGAETTILLGIEDVTVRRALEREKDDLLRQKDILLEESAHEIPRQKAPRLGVPVHADAADAVAEHERAPVGHGSSPRQVVGNKSAQLGGLSRGVLHSDLQRDPRSQWHYRWVCRDACSRRGLRRRTLLCAGGKTRSNSVGLDAAEALLDVARKRTPSGDFRQGEMEELPFADGTFDVVTGFNSLQYAADPVNALRQARRVSKPSAKVAMAVWGWARLSVRSSGQSHGYFAAAAASA